MYMIDDDGPHGIAIHAIAYGTHGNLQCRDDRIKRVLRMCPMGKVLALAYKPLIEQLFVLHGGSGGI